MANESNSLGSSGTFVYSPDISVCVKTIDGTIIDISKDIINFTLDREINQVSTFTATLNNDRRYYVTPNKDGNRPINTMDRITVFLKRTNFIQCFTGYITYAPIITLQPEPVTIQASCTLRILQITYWDDTLIGFQQLLLNVFDQSVKASTGTVNDGGVAQALVNVLYKVCGWNPKAIHIQSIPDEFLTFAVNAYNQQIIATDLNQSGTERLSIILSAQGVANGISVSTGKPINGQQGSGATNNPPNYATTDATSIVPFFTSPLVNSKENYPGPNSLNPVSLDKIIKDKYYCSAPWDYLHYQITPDLTQEKKQSYQKIQNIVKTWLSHNPGANTYDGRLLLLTNIDTDRQVAVRVTSIPQKESVTENGHAVYDSSVKEIQCHPAIVEYLRGDIKDPSNFKNTGNHSKKPVNVLVSWADETKIFQAGVQPNPSKTIINNTDVTNGSGSVDVLSTTGVLITMVQNLLTQVGDKYSLNPLGNKGSRINPGRPGTGTGSFDCSGLAWWGYATIGIYINNDKTGASSTSQTLFGPSDGSQANKYGAWKKNTEPPAVGDLLFWHVKQNGSEEGGQSAPQHVSIMISKFGDPPPKDKNGKRHYPPNSDGVPPGNNKGNPDVAYIIEAQGNGSGPNVHYIRWSQIKAGHWRDVGNGYKVSYMGARSPINLHPKYTSNELTSITQTQVNLDNINANGTSEGINPVGYNLKITNPNNPSNNNSNSNANLSGGRGSSYSSSTASGSSTPSFSTGTIAQELKNSYNTLLQQPQYNIVASMIVASPRAFLLDNPVMQDITAITNAGLRSYMSAPNGDFVAFFPDYYGVYGQKPSLDISPVEIINFQMYHDDNQLTTHVGVVGDTTALGTQMSPADFINTNGIVSIQDTATMALLFKSFTSSTVPNANSIETDKRIYSFLNRYGMRPYVSQQQMIRTHTMEYLVALYTFMQQWGNQYASTVTFAFLPELYPGMRINIQMPNGSSAPDQYQFFVQSVIHSGDRTTGFTTQATLTSPVINGKPMRYGYSGF